MSTSDAIMGVPGRFDGKVAVVTAGASGIGRACVLRLLAEGASVVVGDTDAAGLATLVDEADTSQLATVVCDVRVEAHVEAMVDAALERFGQLDVGINAAGKGSFGEVTDMSLGDWQHVIDITATGTFLAVKHEARAMRRSGSGSIVNVASINAIQPSEGCVGYNAAKAAVVGITTSAALELGRFGIRVNGVGPGLVETPMTTGILAHRPLLDAYHRINPMRRHGQAAEVAAIALFLAADDASWITGQTVYVDGGQTIAGYPPLLELRSAAGTPTPDASART